MAQGNSGYLDELSSGTAADSCPSLIELAAFVERSADQNHDAAMARHVASCDRCANLAAQVTSDDVSADRMTFVPEHVRVAAMALVPGTQAFKGHHTNRRSMLWPALRWGSAAAAAILISAVGYHVGAGMENSNDSGDQLAIELSFQLMEDSNFDDELQLFPLDQQGVLQ